MRNLRREERPIAAFRNRSGLTLIELLVVIAILGILIVGLGNALNSALSAFGASQDRDDLVSKANYVMERVVMFALETDKIGTADDKKLQMTERVLDTYVYDPVASVYAYSADGDGILDADNDGNGLVNEGGVDEEENVTFAFDKDTGTLTEVLPNYKTKTDNDYLPPRVLCTNVALFTCIKLQNDLLGVTLELNDGKSSIRLTTRIRTRRIRP